MRSFGSRGWACDRAQQAVSLDLDGELSQLERTLLDRHLERCPSCAALATDATAFTRELRGAELVRLERPIELPLRRRLGYGVRRSGAWAAAASVAAMALLAVFTLPAQRVQPVSQNVRDANADLQEFRILRSKQLKPIVLRVSQPRRGPQLET